MEEGINTDVSQEDVIKISDAIKILNKNFYELAVEIFKIETDKSKLSKPSVFIFSAINRTIALNRGFLTLTAENNYITAINLLRLQADSCMRVFALSLVSDRADFFDHVFNEKHIRSLIDAEGNKMTDEFLSSELDKLFPGFRTLYKNTSGFIHFSHEHLKQNQNAVFNEQTFSGEIFINGQDNFTISQKVDFNYNMHLVGTELYRLIRGYKEHVREFMENF